MKRLALATIVGLAACVAALSAATLQQIRLTEGHGRDALLWLHGP
jgi:hypothetical protein